MRFETENAIRETGTFEDLDPGDVFIFNKAALNINAGLRVKNDEGGYILIEHTGKVVGLSLTGNPEVIYKGRITAVEYE